MHALGRSTRRIWQFKCKCKVQRALLQQSRFIAKISGQNQPKWPAAAAASSSRALFGTRRQHAAWRRGQTWTYFTHNSRWHFEHARQDRVEDESLQGCLHTATALLAISCNNCLPFGNVNVGGRGRVYQHPLGLYEWRVVCFYCCCCMLLLLASAQVRLECSVRLKDAHFIFSTSSHCDVCRRGEIIIIIIICQHVRFPGKNALSVQIW